MFTRAAPAFDNLFMGCVFSINTVHKTVEKLTFQAFYRSKFVKEGVITSTESISAIQQITNISRSSVPNSTKKTDPETMKPQPRLMCYLYHNLFFSLSI